MIKNKFSAKFIFVAVLLGIVLAPLSAYTEETKENLKAVSQPAEETQVYIQQLEKRISDLEAIVNTLLEEKKIPSPVPSGEVPKEKPEAPPAVEDEWAEPVVETTPVKGRDEDARRRISELETWQKKLAAGEAKREEESRDKTIFTLSGKYKLRLNIKDNINLNNPGQKWTYDNTTYFDQRFQLRLEAEHGPLTGVVVFDKGNFVFDWKEDSEGTLDRWSEFHTVNSALVRELYVQYTGDFIVKAGRQNVMLGNEGIVLEGPVDAFKVSYPFGKTPLGVLTGSLSYIAVAGGFRDFTDFGAGPAGDRSAVMGVANKLDGYLLSINLKPAKGLSIEPYVLKVFDRGRAGNSDLNLDKDFNAGTTPRDGDFQPLWTGLAISGDQKKVSYTADLIYLTDSYSGERDISAYAFLASGDYKFGDIGFLGRLSAGLEAGLGSGNETDDPSDSDYKNFRGLFLCKDRRKFGNIFSEDLRAGYFFWDSSLANVTFGRAVIGLEPVPELRTSLAFTKYWTTEAVFKGQGPVPGIDWSRGTSLSTEKTKEIGWGLDLDLSFPIYKNRLTGFSEAGYFVPGAVYQQADGQKADPASKIVIGAEFEF
ncbi:MAG: hypothetical protein C4526_08710 [Nitrospiraceae bacterium]|nr:MAG: hypothetical protein C4526_08710 [Nitrospiraceae bacterium]